MLDELLEIFERDRVKSGTQPQQRGVRGLLGRLLGRGSAPGAETPMQQPAAADRYSGNRRDHDAEDDNRDRRRRDRDPFDFGDD